MAKSEDSVGLEIKKISKGRSYHRILRISCVSAFVHFSGIEALLQFLD